MSLPPSAPARSSSRVYAGLEWMLILGLSGIVAWTTLCLGGYLARTMIVSGSVVLGLGALGGILWAIGQGAESRVINRAVLLPVPYLLYALASVLWQAPAPWLAWREWLLWFQMWLVFALLLHFGRSRAHTWGIVAVIAGLALAGTVMAAYQRLADPHWLMLDQKLLGQYLGRSSGMFTMPNSLAGFFGLVTPVCLALLSSRTVKPWAKIICGWLAALFILALAFTGSRGGWLCLGLALMLWPLLAGRTWRKKITGTALVFGSVFASLWALYLGSEYARDRIRPFLSGEFELSRPYMWKGGYEIWRDHPWFGTGAASYNVVFDQYRPQGFRNEPLWTHNDYLNTLSDYGLVGFVLWGGAAAVLVALGWAAIGRARRAGPSSGPVFARAKWKLGLFLGLLAFALHLGVDFHTKVPALAFFAAISLALLLRDEPGLRRPVPDVIRWGSGALLAVVVAGLAWRVAWPLYRAEALRFEARGSIDQHARTRQGDLGVIAASARRSLGQAVRIDPANGQAWSDLAYATALSSNHGGDPVSLGRFAELAADKAINLCPIKAEFWVRKGSALHLQGGRPEAEECFRRALQLAPKSGPFWHAYAYYLQAFPNRQGDARAALATCLTLDPYYPPAESLRQQLVPAR